MKKLFFALLLLPFYTQGQVITTYAGDSVGFGGDGGPAVLAELRSPAGVTAGNGNVYIADMYNYRVRMVNASGVISTIAGNGVQGYSGDGSSAGLAELNNPVSVAVDDTGNVYIADQNNHVIRKVNTSGIISTVAGNGYMGAGGVGAFSGDGGPADSAELNFPSGVAVDHNGNLYIADTYDQRVRKVNTAGVISTIAGNGISGYSGDGAYADSAELSNPLSVAVDISGNVYIADFYNNRIRKVNTSGIITTVAGNGFHAGTGGGFSGDGGPADSAELYNPAGVAVDSLGTLYISDATNQRIRKVVNDTITTFAGTGSHGYSGDYGPAILAELFDPSGIALDGAGNLYIADEGNSRIRRIGPGAPVLVSDPVVSQAINIYPNPATTSLTITAPHPITNITITNILGQAVYTHDYNSNNAEVDISALPAGVYIVRINKVEVRKIVKEYIRL